MKLTKRQRDVLEKMLLNRDDDYLGELVYERGYCYLGDEVVHRNIFWSLLRMCAISLNNGGKPGNVERYLINETGENYLKVQSTKEVGG